MKGHDEARYKCDQCTKTFAKTEDLRHHRSVHTGVYKFECQVCMKGFNRNDRLQKHYQTHR